MTATSNRVRAESSTMLEATELWKTFGATKALRGVSIDIRRGEIHGLCGQNGAGKSTLVKVLTGSLRPDSGSIRLLGERVRFAKSADAQAAGIAVVDQELSVVPALSVAENIRLGAKDAPLLLRRRSTAREVVELLQRVGIRDLSPSTRLETLSMPLRQLVEIARLLDRDAQLLVLDEPTASLSRGDSLVIFSALRELAEHGHSVLYVSHRLDEVLDLCNRITVLRDGTRVGVHDVAEIDHEMLVRLIIGESGTRKVIDSALRAANQHQQEPEARPARHSDTVIENVSLPPKVGSFSYRLHPGEIVGLAGQVGSGASEILRAVAGLEPDASVWVDQDGRKLALRKPAHAIAAGIYYVSNDRQGEGLFLQRSISTNLIAMRLRRLSKFGFVQITRAQQLARSLAQRMGVRGAHLSATASELSGGNQQKVLIGRTLDVERNRLLLLDEPTRGVDVGGRADIHTLIRTAAAAGTSVFFSSGEPDEILSLADTVITLQAGRVVAIHPRGELDEARLLVETTGTGTQAKAFHGT